MNVSWPLFSDNERVVLVLGAGATISDMDTVVKSSKKLPPTDLNFLQTAQRCVPIKYRALSRAFDTLWGDGPAYPLKHQRMEQLFAGAYLLVQQTNGKTRRGRAARAFYDELVLLLRETLVKTTDLAFPKQHYALIREILEVGPDSFKILSFNYDCLIERALRHGSLRGEWAWNHHDGYGFIPSNHGKPKVPSNVSLLKLHGSMNWYIKLPGQTRQTAFDSTSSIHIPAPAANPKATAWHRKQRTIGHSQKRAFPLLVPPVFEKGTQIKGVLQDIWSQAQAALDKATIVIVWGYSLPITDYHAEILFAQGARRSHSRLIVINPNREALARVTQVAGHNWSRWFFQVEHLGRLPNDGWYQPTA